MIEIYTDGASSGNPGLSGAGIYIKVNGSYEKHSIPLGEYTNHEAEFYAVIKALEICKTKFPGEILSLRSDSKVVVDTMEKDYTKNKAFQPLLQRIQEEGRHFSYVFIKWIPSHLNKQADELAKSAIYDQTKKST